MAEYLSVLTTFEQVTVGQPPRAPWADEDNQPALVCATPTDPDGVAAYSGTKQLECALLAPGAIGSNLRTQHISIAPYYANEFLVDVRIRFGGTYPFNWTGGGSGMHACEFYDGSGGSGGYTWLLGHIVPDEEGLNFAIYADGNSVHDGAYFSVSGAARRAWHRVRYYYNVSTGRHKVWWDSSLIINVLDPLAGGYKWNNWTPLANFPGTSAVYPAYAYMDYFRLFTDQANTEDPETDIVQRLVTNGSMINGDPVADESDGGGGGISNKLALFLR